MNRRSTLSPGDKPLTRRTPLKASPDRTREFIDRGRQTAARKLSRPRPVSPASTAQRRKVAGRLCVSCGGSGPCDPAHLCPRSHGGCDHPDCVWPLCRRCHRDFDEGRLDLEAVLALPDYVVERQHMVGHMSLRRCIERLTGRRLVDGERVT